MLKQFDKKDIDIIMKIWKDNNQKFQSFVPSDYWAKEYVSTRNQFLENNVYVYTEASDILAFIAVNPDNEIINMQVVPRIQREGIGRLLVDKLKMDRNNLSAKIFEKNADAILFFKAIGFKKYAEEKEEETNENYCLMKWGEGEAINKSFIFFNNSIKPDIINKFEKMDKVHFFNINTENDKDENYSNINISNFLNRNSSQTVIKDYIGVRNKLSNAMKTENVIIYFDCNETYEYLYDVIKDIAKTRKVNLSIVMHEPFFVEGTKKQKIYEFIKDSFENYNFIDIDYEKIGNDTTISFKEAFDKCDEEILNTICK